MIRPVVFNIDCGEALVGHTLFATGLRVDGLSDDSVHAEYTSHTAGKPVHQMASLTYNIVPALSSLDSSRRDIEAEVRIVPPADPRFWPSVLSPGGEREVSRGAAVTRGAFGPFVVPEPTRQIDVRLINIGISTGEAGLRDPGPSRTLGEIQIDLISTSVNWVKA